MFNLILSLVLIVVFLGGMIWLLCGYMELNLAVNATFCGFGVIVVIACIIEFVEGFFGNLYRMITLQSYDNPAAYAPLIIVAAIAALVAYICGKNFIRIKRYQ